MRLAVLSDPVAREELFLRNVVPPFEDALANLPGATLVSVPSRRRDRRPGRPAWLSAIRTVRRADASFWTQFHLRPAVGIWALAYSHPLALRGMLAIEQWEARIDDLARIVDAQRMGVCFVLYREAWLEFERRYPRLPIERLRLGFDRELFVDQDVERDIYAFWMGRRYEPLHRALEQHCRTRGLVYRYSTSRHDPATRAELADLMARSRYFVVAPPNLQDALRTGSFSPVTSRYLEGTGSGCRLVGVMPDRTEFLEFFDEEALAEVEPDGLDLGVVLDRADQDPRAEEIRTAARGRAHREHGWDERAREVHRRLGQLLEERT